MLPALPESRAAVTTSHHSATYQLLVFSPAAFPIDISITSMPWLCWCVFWTDSGHLLAVLSSAAFSHCAIKQIIQSRSDLLFWLSSCFGAYSVPLCAALPTQSLVRVIYTCRTQTQPHSSPGPHSKQCFGFLQPGDFLELPAVIP